MSPRCQLHQLGTVVVDASWCEQRILVELDDDKDVYLENSETWQQQWTVSFSSSEVVCTWQWKIRVWLYSCWSHPRMIQGSRVSCSWDTEEHWWRRVWLAPDHGLSCLKTRLWWYPISWLLTMKTTYLAESFQSGSWVGSRLSYLHQKQPEMNLYYNILNLFLELIRIKLCEKTS